MTQTRIVSKSNYKWKLPRSSKPYNNIFISQSKTHSKRAIETNIK